MPQPSAEFGGRLALREATCPGGEEAVTAKAIELGEDRDHRVVGGLNGKVIEIAAGRVGERRRAAADLESRLPIEKGVEATNRLVLARSSRVQRLNPGL
jgi:hypothetical protein